MNAGRMLRYAREQAGLTQRELGERSGIAQPTIARAERGRLAPRVDTLERLLRACGFELDLQPLAGEGIDRTTIRPLLRLRPAERARLAVTEARNLARLRARERS